MASQLLSFFACKALCLEHRLLVKATRKDILRAVGTFNRLLPAIVSLAADIPKEDGRSTNHHARLVHWIGLLHRGTPLRGLLQRDGLALRVIELDTRPDPLLLACRSADAFTGAHHYAACYSAMGSPCVSLSSTRDPTRSCLLADQLMRSYGYRVAEKVGCFSRARLLGTATAQAATNRKRQMRCSGCTRP